MATRAYPKPSCHYVFDAVANSTYSRRTCAGKGRYKDNGGNWKHVTAYAQVWPRELCTAIAKCTVDLLRGKPLIVTVGSNAHAGARRVVEQHGFGSSLFVTRFRAPIHNDNRMDHLA